MDTRVERVDDTTVKLAVTVEPIRVKAALDEAARHLADEVKIPGFRKGRVPRKVLESRLGKGAIIQHAVQDSLPQFYAEAVRDNELEPVGQPKYELEEFEEGKDGAFSATVEVRPEFDPPAVEGVMVPHPEWEVTDGEVTEQIDSMRERFAEAETVDRPLQIGDLAVLSISAQHQGTPVDDASMDDQLYKVNDPNDTGQALDRELLGKSTGNIVKFTDTFDDDQRELDFTVIVKDVKALQLPDADDDFAITASEFDTIDELRDSVRTQMAIHKLRHAQEALRGRVVETISELVEVPLPATLVEQETQFQLARLTRDAERYQIPFERYLEAADTTFEQLTERLRDQARMTVRAQLVVDRIGRDADVEVTQEDLTMQLLEQAGRLQMPPEQLAEFMRDPDRIAVLYSDTFRRKTIDQLLGRVEITDAPPPDLLEQLEAKAEAEAHDDDFDDDEQSGDASTIDEATAAQHDAGDEFDDDEDS